MLLIYFTAIIYIFRFLLPSAFNLVHSELTRRFGVEVLAVNNPVLGLSELSFEQGRFKITQPAYIADLAIDKLYANFDRSIISQRRMKEIKAEKASARIDLNLSPRQSNADNVEAAFPYPPFNRLSIEDLTVTVSGLPSLEKVLKLNLNFNVTTDVASLVLIKVSKLKGGVEKKFAVSELNTDIQLDPKKDLAIRSASLNIGTIDLGIKISNLKSRFSYSGSIMKLAETTGQILGGTISVVPTEINFAAAGKRDLVISVNEIEIAEILALYPSERVHGVGKIAATIPLTIGENGYSIRGGKLESVGGGRFKAILGDVKDSGDLSIAAQALRDMHFDSLSGSIDLTESGDLAIALQITGKNPEMNNGQPLNVNLKVEENLRALLKTLRITDNIADTLRGN
jgi:hypothetical protein